VNPDTAAVARALLVLGDRATRTVAYQAINGYRYQQIKIAVAISIVRAFRAVNEVRS
jgi:hypothetical protein